MTVGESGKPFFGRQLIIAASRRMSDCREFDVKFNRITFCYFALLISFL